MPTSNIDRELGFNTRALHAGYDPDPTTHARAVPIYQTTSYIFDDAEDAAALFALQKFGNIYTRIMNPTTAVLESAWRLARKTAWRHSVPSSGQAAQFLAITTLLAPGDQMVTSSTLYGGTYTQFDVTLRRLGYDFVFIEPDDPENFRKAHHAEDEGASMARPSATRAATCWTSRRWPKSRRGGRAADDRQHLRHALSCRPIDHGANIVVHSLTKFMGGHGNSIGGIIVDGGKFDWKKRQVPRASPSRRRPITA